MIFVGNGSLVKRAIEYSIANEFQVDKVFSSNVELQSYCKGLSIEFYAVNDINTQLEEFYSSDKIVLSINNPFIFKPPILDLPGFRFYNIHNGVLPCYRGIPSVCVLFALLNGETDYGVSLHAIDAGIDTGACYAMETFSIGEEDTFQSVMIKSLDVCHHILCTNLDKIRENKLQQISKKECRSRLFSNKDLNSIDITGIPRNRLKRAFHLGVFELWFETLRDKKKELGLS
jgi:methionyl-tRNA formyltransferase